MAEENGFTIDRVATAHLRVAVEPLSFEHDHSTAIRANWQTAQAANPKLFNGIVHLCSEAEIRDRTLFATCHAVRFATLLFWRKRDARTGLRNTFGDVILRGTDGGILLGRMASDTANAGRLCLPGGSFDENDVTDGRIDAERCIVRECAEETGFVPTDFTLAADLLIYRDQRRVAVSRVADLPVNASEARDRALQFLATEAEPELDDIMVVSSPEDTRRLIPDTYEQRLIDFLFRETAR